MTYTPPASTTPAELASHLRSYADATELSDRYMQDAGDVAMIREAADTIDRLTAESARLRSREVLTEISVLQGQVAESRGLLSGAMCDVVPRSGLAAEIEDFLARTSQALNESEPPHAER